MSRAVRYRGTGSKYTPFEFLEICGGVRVSDERGEGGGNGWGGVGLGPRRLFPTCNLGPYTKEVELFVGEEGAAVETIGVLECYNEGRVVIFFVSGGVADPAQFLCDCEGGIGRVVGGEAAVALLWGPGTSSFAYSDWDTVYEYFGPFDIGPCCEVDRGL